MTMKHVITDLTGTILEIEDIPAGVDPLEHMQRKMDDCPLCQEARARGEVPRFATPSMVRELNDDLARQRLAALRRRPRWRDLKRKAR
jgi:hypothetical protein